MFVAEQIRKELRLLIREMGLLSHNCLNSGMTLAQAHILSYLKQNGATSFGEIQLQLGIDKASLSRILNLLEQKQYIAIHPDKLDRRAKNVELLSPGFQAIEAADRSAARYITDILEPFNDEPSELAETLKVLRLLALRHNIIRQNKRIRIERVAAINYASVIELVSEVFCREQSIPAELVPVKSEQQPVWWCARVGEDIIAAVASWLDNGEWHWGRFAVDSRLRGLGIGKRVAISSLRDTFKLGADCIYLDARDITASMVKKLGGKAIGTATDFYGQAITPMILTRADFNNCADAACPGNSLAGVCEYDQG